MKTTTHYAEDIESRINNRCLDAEYPNLSDLLGSDWGANYGTSPLTPDQYREVAVKHAYRIFPSYFN